MGIDACCWSNRRGFGRFTRELVTRMVDDFPAHEYTLVVDAATAREARFPQRARLAVVRTREQPTRAASARGARSVADLLRMSRAAARLPLDVFFFPAVYSFFPLLRRVPVLVTFHDAIAENHPELVFPGWRSRLFWSLKSWLARAQAERLLTVSESARTRIAEAFGYPSSSIHIVGEAPSAAFRPVGDPAARRAALERHRLPAGVALVLYVGGISPHKNIGGLLRAFARVVTRIPCHLAIVGDYDDDAFHGCYRELLQLRGALGLEGHASFTGFVPDADVAALMSAAALLVLPSFEEGFGLPAVEAMACGLPVAASRRGSLPGLVGAAGVLFEPEDVEAISEAIHGLLQDEPRRRRLGEEALRRARGFSWPEAARATVALLEQMASGAAKR